MVATQQQNTATPTRTKRIEVLSDCINNSTRLRDRGRRQHPLTIRCATLKHTVFVASVVRWVCLRRLPLDLRLMTETTQVTSTQLTVVVDAVW